VLLLQRFGPVLPRPHADVIVTSRHSNMKELRASVDEQQFRVLYAFDPRRIAMLLIGGDKTGDPAWYDRFVPIADAIFDKHLAAMKEEKRHAEKFQRATGQDAGGRKSKVRGKGKKVR
jgi:hypothetical protein